MLLAEKTFKESCANLLPVLGKALLGCVNKAASTPIFSPEYKGSEWQFVDVMILFLPYLGLQAAMLYRHTPQLKCLLSPFDALRAAGPGFQAMLSQPCSQTPTDKLRIKVCVRP